MHGEAATVRVTDLVRNELGLPDAGVDVIDGGARGMRVTVTLVEEDRSFVPALERVLAAYLFEASVEVL
jgi:fatty-acyl-CoA synthase